MLREHGNAILTLADAKKADGSAFTYIDILNAVALPANREWERALSKFLVSRGKRRKAEYTWSKKDEEPVDEPIPAMFEDETPAEEPLTASASDMLQAPAGISTRDMVYALLRKVDALCEILDPSSGRNCPSLIEVGEGRLV